MLVGCCKLHPVQWGGEGREGGWIEGGEGGRGEGRERGDDRRRMLVHVGCCKLQEVVG